MIIVPIEENHTGLASATDAKFRAPDISGSGLEALGVGLAKLGDGGLQFASALDEKRRRELAAEIAAAHLDDDHQRNLDDAAVKKAYVDYSDRAAALLHGDNGILNHAGAGAHAAFPALVAALADSHDNAMASLDPIQRGAVAPALGDRLRSDVARAAAHVRAQGAVEQQQQSASLQQAAARDAVTHDDDPDLHDHHMATGENAIRQRARIANLPDKDLDRQLADYRSVVHADTIRALNLRDPVAAASWYARFGGELNELDRRRVASGLAPTRAVAAVVTDANGAGAEPSSTSAIPNVGDDSQLVFGNDNAAPSAALSESLSPEGGTANPYAGLRELFGHFPGGGELRDANSASGKADELSPEVLRQRAELAARWRRLTPQQRLNDAELSTPARAIEAARVLLLRRDPRLKRNLGVGAMPGGKYVTDLIVHELAYKVIHDSIAAGHKFAPVSDADLKPGGRHSMYLYDQIKEAAADALNYRQQLAWDFFTTGDRPYTKEQAAGLIAALTMENNLDPDKLQESGGGGYGIAQWNNERSYTFQQVMKSPLRGSTFEKQLAFVKYELDRGVYKAVGDQLRNTRSAYDSGFLITKSYEVPRERVQTPINRGRYANEVFAAFHAREQK